MPKQHAVLGASSAYRWMHCTPSAMFTKDMPDKTSVYAEEGTKAHAIAERCLNDYLHGDKTEIVDEDKEIYTEVLPYIQRCIGRYEELKAVHPDAVMFIETKVSFETWVPKGFGTADCIILAGNELHVRDLKFGKGVPVSAIDNPQARCYGLGAYDMFHDLYDIDTVVNEIDQVRLEDGYSEEVLTAKELTDWGDKELKPLAKKAYSGKGEFVTGEWCRFCKARAVCPHRAKEDLPVIAAAGDVPSTMSDEAVTAVLLKKKELTEWLNALEQYMFDKVQAAESKGEKVDGWKIVEGRSTRQYIDELQVADACKKAGIDEALIYDRKLIGLTKMQTVLGGKKKMGEILGDLIVKPAGKPTLVPDTDARKDITSSAADDFKNIEEKK